MIKAVEIMFSIGQIDRATLFLEACVEFGVISLEDDINRIFFQQTTSKLFAEQIVLSLFCEHVGIPVMSLHDSELKAQGPFILIKMTTAFMLLLSRTNAIEEFPAVGPHKNIFVVRSCCL